MIFSDTYAIFSGFFPSKPETSSILSESPEYSEPVEDYFKDEQEDDDVILEMDDDEDDKEEEGEEEDEEADEVVPMVDDDEDKGEAVTEGELSTYISNNRNTSPSPSAAISPTPSSSTTPPLSPPKSTSPFIASVYCTLMKVTDMIIDMSSGSFVQAIQGDGGDGGGGGGGGGEKEEEKEEPRVGVSQQHIQAIGRRREEKYAEQKDEETKKDEQHQAAIQVFDL